MAQRNLGQLRLVKLDAIVEALLAKVKPEDLAQRYAEVTTSTTKHVASALRTLSNGRLRQIVALCPELSERDIDRLFEEFRYGARPAFSLYLVNCPLSQGELEDAILAAVDWEPEEEHRTRVIDVDQFDKGVFEVAFSYQTIHEYLDPATEALAERPELEYGFLWLAPHGNYMAIESCPMPVAQYVRKSLADSGIRSVPLRFHQDVVDSVVSPDELRAAGFRILNPSDDEPINQRYSDPNMGNKQRFMHEMRRRSEQLEGVYEQRLSDGDRTNLRFNNRGGRIAFSKRLPTSSLRRHGCAIIEKLVATLQSYLETDLSSFARIVSFESVWGHRVSAAARPSLKTLVAAIHVAKREGRGQVGLGEVTARRLLEAMPRYWHAALMAYCDQCAADQPVRCARCDSVITPANTPSGCDCTCSQDVPLDVRALCCWDAHSLDPADCSVEVWPSLRAVELVAEASREIAAQGFTPTEDAFVIRDDQLVMTKIDVNEVLIAPIGIPELRHVADLPSDDLRGASTFAVKLVEKCKKAGNCTNCGVSIRDGRCLMNVLRLVLNVTPRPHHGHEFGDAALQITIEGRCLQARLLAKKGSARAVTPGSPSGQELIRQTVSACMDSRTQAVVVAIPATCDDQLRTTLREVCRWSKRWLVILDLNYLARATALAFDKECLDG